MYYMALYLKYFRKSKNTLKWFVFSCVPSQMRTLIIWKKTKGLKRNDKNVPESVSGSYGIRTH